MSGLAQTTRGSTLRCAWCAAELGEDRQRLAGRSRCAACGSTTTDPWPTDEQLDAAYSGAYRPRSGRFSGPGDRILRAMRGRLAGRIDALSPPGPVLDVGAGDGALLDALARVGREGVGLERESRRDDVIAGDVEDHAGSYAAVVMWHSLEHLRRPGEALAAAAGLLMPGGLLVIALPNADSLQARAFGDRWLALDLPRHLVHVGADAVVARLEALGLAVERVSHVRGGQVVFGWLHGIVGTVLSDADLYDAIRRPAARSRALAPRRRIAVLATAALMLPAAVLAALAEVCLRRGGTVYVEARHA